MSIQTRLLKEPEGPLANRFFNSIYGSSRSDQDFAWEFLNGPFGKAIYVIAVDRSFTPEKIVGIQCAIPIELIGSKGQIVRTGKSEDTLVDPAYRGKKIFEQMYDLLFAECKNAGIKYIWGFTPARKAFERIGFDIPFKTEQALLVFKLSKAYQYLKVLNPKNTASDHLKIFGLTCYSWLKGLFIGSPVKEIAPEDLSGKEENLFLRFYSESDYYTIHETAAYTDWRIAKNPFGNRYKKFRYPDAGAPVFHALVNVKTGVSYIEQMFYQDQSLASSGLTILTAEIKKSGVPLVRVLCFSHNEDALAQKKLLKKNGFVLLERGSFFVWKSLTDERLIEPEKLFVTRLFTQGNQ
jgi:GNAT superfamily N-acetyltransferase